MIFPNIEDLVEFLNKERARNSNLKIVATSGGFDPVHIGHLKCFQGSVALKDSLPEESVFIIIANSDGFLMNKKDFVFMPENERLEILHAFKGVDHVTSWYDGTQTCIGALEMIQPDFFTKGGDRSSRDKIPESDICDAVNCKIMFNVGGGKIQSSSWLTKKRDENKSD